MAIQFLKESDARAISLSASVCVVGAGVAGLIAATRLARKTNRRIIVVESGLRHFDGIIGALNKIDNPTANYRMDPTVRFRGLGGNSTLWAGKLLPLTRSDAGKRPYLDLDGWPFDIGELDKYRDEIEALMGIDRESYEEEICARLGSRSPLPRNDGDFVLRWPKRPTPKNHNLAHVFRNEVEILANLEIWLGATVAGFEFDKDSNRVMSLRAVNHAGQMLKITAGEYVIAAGAFDSTRLLLMADRQSNRSISKDSHVLGRYFNDHLGFDVARLRPIDRTATNAALSDRSPFSALRHLHFELRPEVQQASGVSSAFFDIGVMLPESSALSALRAISNSVKSKRPSLRSSDLCSVILDLPSLVRTAHWQVVRKQKYWPPNADLWIKIWAEQIPAWQNRIYLSNQVDDLNLPIPTLDWERSETDEKTFRVMVKKIERYWRQHLAGICELEWHPLVSTPGSCLADAAEDLAHPAGSTRMGTSPSNSVVDTNLTVHRIPNLSVTSSSVFPSSGSANPTLTIMQLTMRATDAIANRIAS